MGKGRQAVNNPCAELRSSRTGSGAALRAAPSPVVKMEAARGGSHETVLEVSIGIPPGFSHTAVVPPKSVVADGVTGYLLRPCQTVKDGILVVCVGIHAPVLGVILLSMMNDEGGYHRPPAPFSSSCGTWGQRVSCWLRIHQCDPGRRPDGWMNWKEILLKPPQTSGAYLSTQALLQTAEGFRV